MKHYFLNLPVHLGSIGVGMGVYHSLMEKGVGYGFGFTVALVAGFVAGAVMQFVMDFTWENSEDKETEV